jgi:sugar lactone lactonase YvrE
MLATVAACAGKGDEKEPGAAPAAEPLVVREAGLATPESILHDPLSDVYFISNINGGPTDQDDNGFISAMSPTGEMIALKWADGATDSVTLHAPKGMIAAGDFLYVTDITTIRRFDRQTGGPRGETPIPGATFLNDLYATGDGTLYFTDSGFKMGAAGLEPSGTDAVYRLGLDGKLDTLARGEMLGHPNGIVVTGDSVWVVSFGTGELYRVVNGQKADVVKLPKGQLDGVLAVNNELLISSWEGSTVYRGVPPRFTELLQGVEAPADIGHDAFRHRLLVPLFNANEIRIVPLAPF